MECGVCMNTIYMMCVIRRHDSRCMIDRWIETVCGRDGRLMMCDGMCNRFFM